MVYMYINGIKRGIIIDDYIPVRQDGYPAFVSGHDEEVWFCLVEKAWAKMHGSYAGVASGMPCQAAYHISGVPSKSINHNNLSCEAFRNLIQGCDLRGDTMFAVTNKFESKNGIEAGQVYSLIGCIRVHSRGKIVTLVKLRDSSGKCNWQGEWSASSALWTPQLKQQSGLKEDQTDIFFMNIEEYKANFAATSICMAVDPTTYNHSSFQHYLPDSRTAFFSFSLTKAIDCTKQCFGITIAQQGDRLLKQCGSNSSSRPSAFSIILMTDDGKLIKATDDEAFNVTMHSADLQTKLPAGTYILAIDPVWNDTAKQEDAYRTIVVDIYCQERLSIFAIDVAAGFRTLKTAFKHLAKKSSAQS